MKQTNQQQPWMLSFRARARRFDFKFKCSKILPVCKLLRLSIRLNLRPFTLEFESKPESAFSLRRKLSDLRLLDKIRRFRSRRFENKGILSRKNYFWGKRESRRWLWILLLAAAAWFVIVQLSYCIRTRLLWRFFWMIWNYFVPSGFMQQFSEVIFYGFSS